MKRLSATAFVLATALRTFAYYGDYGYSSRSSSFELPGWFTFMGFLMIAWGILEIILFFKIWGMTNNIKALKKDHFFETEFESKGQMANYLRKNLVLGNTDLVKRILLQNFIENIETAYKKMQTGAYVPDENGAPKWVDYNEQNRKKPIAPYVDNLASQFKKIGEELPVYITRMQTFSDYFDLFVKEDLTVKIVKKEEER